MRKTVGVFLLGLLCPEVTQATTVDPPEFSGLVNQSDYIVRAVVKSVRAEKKTGSRKIYTRVELEVREVIAGRPPQSLVLVLLGGKLGDEEMILEGAPIFDVGDEDILFVQGNERQIYPLVAMMYGRYPIQTEANTGKQWVARSNKTPLRNVSEVALPMTDEKTTPPLLRVTSSAAALSASEFVRQIKAAVKSDNPRLRER